MSIKKLLNFLIFGKISLGHKDQAIFEEKATDENSIHYYFTTKLKTCSNEDSSESICQVGHNIGYMATMFPFSPPAEYNKPSGVEKISDRVEAQDNRLVRVKRKRDVMLFEDELLFKKHKHFASVLTVDPITELKISFAEPSTTNNKRPVRGVRSAPVDIPKKRCVQL